jgi:hypothetical protein
MLPIRPAALYLVEIPDSGAAMRKAIAATGLATALLVSSVTAATAGDGGYGYDGYHYDGYRDHRGPGPVLGFAGDVLRGAVRIATLPLTLIADVGRDGWHDGHYRHYRDRDYVQEGAYVASQEAARDYYGANARFYGPPPGYYRYDGR